MDLDEEDVIILIKNSKSINKIISLMPQLEETASGVKCTACDKLFIYDFDQGIFFESDALPRSFCNLKKSSL